MEQPTASPRQITVCDGVPYGIVNDAEQDTTPGRSSLFAAPEGFAGDAEAYVAVMRQRFQNPGARLRMTMVAKQFVSPRDWEAKVTIAGPYTEAAITVMRRIVDWMDTPTAR